MLDLSALDPADFERLGNLFTGDGRDLIRGRYRTPEGDVHATRAVWRGEDTAVEFLTGPVFGDVITRTRLKP